MACTEKVVREVAGEFTYCPETGALVRQPGLPSRKFTQRTKSGPVMHLTLRGKLEVVPLARIAWYLGKGEVPTSRILFRNLNPEDLTLANLYTKEMEKSINLTKQDLEVRFSYEPRTGRMTWKDSGCSVGWRAGPGGGNRLVVQLFSRIWQVSHLAVLIQTGSLPPKGVWVDHRDGDPLNNSWENLRLTTPGQNVINCRDHVLKRERKYPRGVIKPTWAKPGCYYAAATRHGQRHLRGPFPTTEAAHEAYKALHLSLHGEFSVYASRVET